MNRPALVAVVKRTLNLIALALVAPAALTCGLEPRGGGGVFLFWTHVLAILPGPPGLFLRRAFYRWTLERCDEQVVIGFGALFTRREASLARGAYVGPYAMIGSAHIRENTLIGTRASLLSGGHQHVLLPSGEWSATEERTLVHIDVGPNTWIGEAAVVMANVGRGCMVAAGAVVSSPVADGVMVGGNPARFVKRLGAGEDGFDATPPPIRRLA